MEKFTAILDCIDAKLIHVEFFPYSVRSFLFVLHDKIADDMEKCLYKFVDSAWRECFRPPKSL
jgi:hypothetical protein